MLSHLLKELVEIRDGLRPGDSDHGIPLGRWEDEEFIYVEADLPGEPWPDIDLCIHGRRAFICMARPSPELKTPSANGRDGRER